MLLSVVIQFAAWTHLRFIFSPHPLWRLFASSRVFGKAVRANNRRRSLGHTKRLAPQALSHQVALQQGGRHTPSGLSGGVVVSPGGAEVRERRRLIP